MQRGIFATVMRLLAHRLPLGATLCVIAALGACQQRGVADTSEIGGRNADGDDVIACAVAGEAELGSACAVERAVIEGQLELTVRKPDGGFRRFVVREDGGGLASADGAHEAVTRYVDGYADVAIQSERYRFPATARQ